MRPFRKMAAALGVATLAGSAGAALAQDDLTSVTMQLDWLFQGPNAGFMLAEDKGFYAEEGLEVEISQGRGSGNTAQLVASKAVQFGFADGYTVANTVSRGAELTMVAGIYRGNPAAAIVLADSGIAAPGDLAGKSIGMPTGSAQFQQWPAAAAGCGLGEDDVSVVNVDPAGAVPALLNGRVAAIGGFAQGYVPGIEIRADREAEIFWFSDCGVVTVSNGIIVHNDTLEENADLIGPFVRASLKGFLYARENPDEAVEVLARYLETADAEIARREMDLSWNTWVTDGTAGEPLGWMSPEEWEATIDVLVTYGGMEERIDPETLYTNDFVPEGEEWVPPQP